MGGEIGQGGGHIPHWAVAPLWAPLRFAWETVGVGEWKPGPRDTSSAQGRFHKAPEITGPAGDRTGTSSHVSRPGLELRDQGALATLLCPIFLPISSPKTAGHKLKYSVDGMWCVVGEQEPLAQQSGLQAQVGSHKDAGELAGVTESLIPCRRAQSL